MKLSNTMIINEALLPSSKKAFTLAEVLITLSILGVVAALTIPSLVNRQSDMAAIVKMKKAISQYEQVVEVYMAENEAKDFSAAAASCTTLKGYFKMVDSGVSDSPTGACVFTTADGVVWSINTAGNGVIYDSKSPKFGVAVWARNGVVNGTGTNALNKPVAPSAAQAPLQAASGTGKPLTAAPTKGYYSSAAMLQINTAANIPTTAPTWTAGTTYPTASS